MRIGIDVESGERPFQELVNGVLNSIQTISDISIFIIGNSEKIKKSFPNIEKFNKIKLINAEEVINMDENPVAALKRKKNSTVLAGINLLKTNEIDTFFSPGNTGATIVASVLNLGMIEGIKKPAMATFFPRPKGGETLILDIGANPDASIENLYQNAILGLAYYKLIWNKEAASIGLLNIGGEQIKGSKITKRAYEELSVIKNFIGNVEGYNVFNGSVDIVVCNGFIGNSILKIGEALKAFFISSLTDTGKCKNLRENSRRIPPFANNQYFLNRLKKKKILHRMSPKFFGAAPLLGVNGSVLIGHGNCTKMDIENTVELADNLYKLNFIDQLKDSVKKLEKKD